MASSQVHPATNTTGSLAVLGEGAGYLMEIPLVNSAVEPVANGIFSSVQAAAGTACSTLKELTPVASPYLAGVGALALKALPFVGISLGIAAIAGAGYWAYQSYLQQQEATESLQARIEDTKALAKENEKQIQKACTDQAIVNHDLTSKIERQGIAVKELPQKVSKLSVDFQQHREVQGAQLKAHQKAQLDQLEAHRQSLLSTLAKGFSEQSQCLKEHFQEELQKIWQKLDEYPEELKRVKEELEQFATTVGSVLLQPVFLQIAGLEDLLRQQGKKLESIPEELKTEQERKLRELAEKIQANLKEIESRQNEKIRSLQEQFASISQKVEESKKEVMDHQAKRLADLESRLATLQEEVEKHPVEFRSLCEELKQHQSQEMEKLVEKIEGLMSFLIQGKGSDIQVKREQI